MDKDELLQEKLMADADNERSDMKNCVAGVCSNLEDDLKKNIEEIKSCMKHLPQESSLYEILDDILHQIDEIDYLIGDVDNELNT